MVAGCKTFAPRHRGTNHLIDLGRAIEDFFKGEADIHHGDQDLVPVIAVTPVNINQCNTPFETKKLLEIFSGEVLEKLAYYRDCREAE